MDVPRSDSIAVFSELFTPLAASKSAKVFATSTEHQYGTRREIDKIMQGSRVALSSLLDHVANSDLSQMSLIRILTHFSFPRRL